MPDDLGQLTMTIHPTAMRPLLGLTVLVVEDSRFASEAIRLLCIRSGARIRRADSLLAAKKHLQLYRPSVLIVDIGLPDGSGMDLVAEMAQNDKADRPVILATSGADSEGFEAEAIALGADGFLTKPIDTVSAFQSAILRHLPKELHPKGPRSLNNDVVEPDELSLREDLSHLDELLRTEPDQLSYVVPFLQGLARLSGDAALQKASDALSQASALGRDITHPIATVRQLISDRLAVSEPV